jgi:hypothetical protein
MPKIGDTNWGTALNQHLGQLNSVDKGGIQTWTSPTRPTKKLVVAATGNTRTGANLDAADEGLTGINTSTGSLEQWNGSKWINLLVGSVVGANTRILGANFIYYVNNNGGNNANDGLTPATAWATPQYACEFISRNVILNGFKLTIKLMDSTTPYTGFYFGGMTSGSNAGLLEFLGNPTNPGACIIDTRDNYGVFRYGLNFGGSTSVSVRGFKIISSVTTMRAYAITCNKLDDLYVHMCDFDTFNFPGSLHILLQNKTYATLGSYTISGSAPYHISVSGSSQLIFGSNNAPNINDTAVAGYSSTEAGNFNSTITNFTPPQTATTLLNNPDFSGAFISIQAYSAAYPNMASYSYTGACTGKKFNIGLWSYAYTSMVNFPGSIAGTVDDTSKEL